MVRRVALRQRFRGALPQQPGDGNPLGAYLGERELVSAGTGDDDEIDAGGQEIGPRSEALAAQPLDAISPHGVPDLAPDHQSQPRRTAAVGLRSHEQRKVRRSDAPPEALRSNELGVPAQPPVRTKPEPHATSAEGYFL
jgi:hypothetical protein